MGDTLLMKTLYILSLILLISLLNANELKWVDEQIEAIKPPRSGISNKKVAMLKDPFIFIKKIEKENGTKVQKAKYTFSKKRIKRKYYPKISSLHLSMIMNKSARINNKWYKENEKIKGYKILKIELSSVTLSKHKKTFLLSTHSKNKNLIIK